MLAKLNIIRNGIESVAWGIIAALGALICEVAIYMGISIYNGSISTITFFQMFTSPGFILAAACTEEILKYIAISGRNEVMPKRKLLILNSFLIGLGFFSIEFVLLSANGSVPPSHKFILEIAIIHIGTAGLIGYFIAAKNSRKFLTFLSAIILTTTFHGMYNLLSLERNLLENYIIFILLGLLIFMNIVYFTLKEPSLARD